jgi:hypothetical protein
MRRKEIPNKPGRRGDRQGKGNPGVFELTWEMPNGRATFAYGAEQAPGEPRIIWRRVGGHDSFKNP